MDNYFITTLPRYNERDGLDLSKTLVIQTIWTDDSIEISLFLTKSNDGFIGTINSLDIKINANYLEMNLDEFIKENKAALTTENGLNNFTYHLEEGGNGTSFKWCKNTDSGITVIYGNVNVSPKTDIKDKIIMNALKVNQMKNQTIEKQKLEFQSMLNDFNLMKTSLDKCIEEKSNLESSMLTKFTALLNTKKKKIAELNRALENRSDAMEEYETDENDSDLEYSSQIYAESPKPSTSHREAEKSVIPKRIKPTTKENVTVVQPVQCNDSGSVDIYDRETQMLLDDM